jgi:hypothetical protein
MMVKMKEQLDEKRIDGLLAVEEESTDGNSDDDNNNKEAEVLLTSQKTMTSQRKTMSQYLQHQLFLAIH